MILSNINDFLAKNKKIFYYISLFFIVSILSSDVTFAEEAASNSTPGSGFFTKEGFIGALNVVMQLIGVMLAIGTYLATLFLSPEWINGSLFGLSKNFKEIWILVSNLVYFVFAFILIWIAFMNIIGKNADQYQLKQALPKFIVGVLIVPFSWFLVQFILSISAILTISSLNLPFDTFVSYGNSMKSISRPTDCTLNLSALKTSDTNSKTETKKSGGDSSNSNQLILCNYNKVESSDVTSIDSIFGVISIYTYGILKFDSVDDISKKFITETKTKSLGDIMIKVLFDVVFVLVYGILIIAIALVLLIRGIYIWIYIMLSPIFGLMYFFDKKDGGGDGFFGKFNLKEFIALAMVPVYTMLALSFGLLFIYTVGVGLSLPDKTQSIKLNKDSLTLGNYSLTIKGNVGSLDSSNVNGFIDAIGHEAGTEGVLGVFGTLILKIFGIIVLWGTVMAALRTSQITKAIVEPLYQFGTKVGGIATSAPGNIPIFGGQSMSSMSTAASTVSSSINTSQNRKGTDLASKFIGATDKDKEYIKLGTNAPATKIQAWENTQKLNKVGKAEDIANSSQAINAYVKNLNKMLSGGLLNNTDEVKRAIEGIKNGRGNAQAIKDNFAILDKNSTDPLRTLLGGKKNIASGNVNENLGSNSKNINPTTNPIKEPSVNQHDKTLKFGDNVLNVKLDSNNNITDLLQSTDELAKYISTNNLNTNQLTELISHLSLGDSAIRQLNKYFKKDGNKIVYASDGNGDSNITDFAKENTSS